MPGWRLRGGEIFSPNTLSSSSKRIAALTIYSVVSPAPRRRDSGNIENNRRDSIRGWNNGKMNGFALDFTQAPGECTAIPPPDAE